MSNQLESIVKQFKYYKSLGDKTFDQVDEKKLFWQPNEESNSIAMIVKHLHGNMMSRWTDFLTSDGEKSWRKRDEEFDNDLSSKEVMLQKWTTGWDCLFDALHQLSEKDLESIIYIRNMGHTVIEAIHRQLAHYAYHVGQIVFLGKLITNEEWASLSIPKGASKTYNADKFAKPKERKHFTDDL